MIEQLAVLASSASPDHRRALLHAVTDLFLVDVDPSETVKEDYARIATHSLDGLKSQDRVSYAERVAASPTLPRTVATRLASDDDAGVARLVLTLSPVLTDADLASIAVTHSQAHLAAIAERATLSETVTEVLVERGDAQVLRTVSGNEGAAFSDSGLSRLMERGASDGQIARNLQDRASRLPAEQAQRVLRIAQATAQASAVGAQPLARQARERRLEVRLLLADLRDGRTTIDEVLLTLAEQDRAFDLAQALGSVADITSAQVLRALLQHDVTGIAVACRAAGATQAGFAGILTLRAQRLGLSAQRIQTERAAYAAVTPELSERAMRFLKVRTKL
ncbi:DUF2336 domain-containing protein [Salinarimonas soli]|uniref:DUF2336 domain-containing protein n=1 Tax=Salinarimonas soli TaxID=1638099 RepID=A0A5B2VVB4_9HYPH|nr:DUF2336 domain-containing protein [Salinarimonas soli]KAA2242262.1 DUF2336 domain-containing protein [Salinarimonas soli]